MADGPSLSTKADLYKERMELALQQRSVVKDLVRDDDETGKNRILLHEAEYGFAEEAFLELSKQATTFQIRLLKITKSLRSLVSKRTELFLQVENEMRAGKLTNEVPIGESQDSGFYPKQRS